jgi:hypothetical protein
MIRHEGHGGETGKKCVGGVERGFAAAFVGRLAVEYDAQGIIGQMMMMVPCLPCTFVVLNARYLAAAGQVMPVKHITGFQLSGSEWRLFVVNVRVREGWCD